MEVLPCFQEKREVSFMNLLDEEMRGRLVEYNSERRSF